MKKKFNMDLTDKTIYYNLMYSSLAEVENIFCPHHTEEIKSELNSIRTIKSLKLYFPNINWKINDLLELGLTPPSTIENIKNFYGRLILDIS